MDMLNIAFTLSSKNLIVGNVCTPGKIGYKNKYKYTKSNVFDNTA